MTGSPATPHPGHGPDPRPPAARPRRFRARVRPPRAPLTGARNHFARPSRPRWLPNAALVALLAVLLGGATASQAQQPQQIADARAFDAAYTTLNQWMLTEQDEQAISYLHDGVRRVDQPGVRIDIEQDFVRVGRGQQAGYFIRERTAGGGFAVDVLNRGGDVDYLLVGDRYQRPMLHDDGRPPSVIAPTPWLTRPAVRNLEGNSGWDPCYTKATLPFCNISRAFEATRAAIPGLPRQVFRQPDGSQIARSGIRVGDLVNQHLFLSQNDALLGKMAPHFERLIPFTITLRPDGSFAKYEVSGRLVAGDLLIVTEFGYESLGPATVADLPNPPAGDDPVTALDTDAYLQFFDDSQRLKSDPDRWQPPPRR